MSPSPFPNDSNHRHRNGQSAQVDAPLTLMQALTITAGLAGLMGLLSGGIIRFALANSPNARFLSPLQTFPTLSDWPAAEDSAETTRSASELDADGLPSENTSVFDDPDTETFDSEPLESESEPGSWEDPSEAMDDWDDTGDLDWQTNDDFDSFRSERFTRTPQSEVSAQRERVPSTFDEFADRTDERSPRSQTDPLKSLSKGPALWNVQGERDSVNTAPDAIESESFESESLERDRFNRDSLE